MVEVSFPSGSSTAAQTFTAPSTASHYWDTWANYSMPFVATGTDVTIHFLGLAGPGYDAGIDNVSVSLVPEPETYAMLLGGLGLLGFMARRGKRNT